MEGAVVRGQRAPGEADSSTEELAALVERNSSPLPIPPGHSLNTIDFAAPAGAEACECVIGPTYLGRTPPKRLVGRESRAQTFNQPPPRRAARRSAAPCYAAPAQGSGTRRVFLIGSAPALSGSPTNA